jgi:hypothetical protein
MGYRLEGQGSIPGKGKRIFVFYSTASILAMGPILPTVQWVPGLLSFGGKVAVA